MSRSPGDVGAGLDPVRPARPIRPGERIHVVGAAGAGASAAALLAQAAGARVDGCDPGGPSPYTPALDAAGIAVAPSHDAAHVSGADRPERLAVTKALTAVAPDHPELAAARAAGLAVEAWQQLVADAAFGRRLVAVAGTHGKSTVAGWLSHVLATAGLDPSAFVGALLPAALTGGTAATARVGRGPLFVVEADEYAGNFDPFRPDVVLLTNVEWDHPDVFADEAAVIEAFAGWLGRAAAGRPAADPLVVVTQAGDGGCRAVVERLVASAGDAARIVGVVATGDAAPPTALPGAHNLANARLVRAAALELGLRPDTVDAGLATFGGVGRRLERLGEVSAVTVYDDYAHHPTAIRVTIDALREREPGRRLWLACEPLTHHRTRAMLGQLADALATADGVLVADIWPGRDTPADRAAVAATDVAAAVRATRADLPTEASGDAEATAARLAQLVRPGDVVLVAGGGASYRIGRGLLERLRVGRADR